MHHASIHGMASNPTLVRLPLLQWSESQLHSLLGAHRKTRPEVRPLVCGFAAGDAHPSLSPAVVQFWTEKLVGVVCYPGCNGHKLVC